MSDLSLEPNPWADRRFRIFCVGNLTNNLGESMYAFTLPLLAYSYTGSLASMAFLMGVTPVVLTVMGPLLGHLVDKHGSRVLVVPGLALQLIASLGFNLVMATHDRAPLWSLYVAEILVQIGAVTYRGGWIAGVPAMFPTMPGRARGSLSALFEASLILGPALAALLVVPLGYEGLLWLNTLSFVAPLIVWFIGINPKAGQAALPSVSQGFLESLRDGARLFTSGSQLGAMAALMIPTAFVFSAGTLSLFIYLGREIFGASPATIGVCLALGNAGALAGSALATILHGWELRTLTMVSLGAAVLGLLLIGGAPTVWLATAGFALASVFASIIEVAMEMVTFSAVPVGYIGRVAGFIRMVQGIPSAAAPIAIGFLSPFVSVQVMFVLMAAVCLVPLVWLLWSGSALTDDAATPETAPG